jgi:hypothetical protein
MRTITNDYRDMRIMNLGSESARWPFSSPSSAVRLTTIRPDLRTSKECERATDGSEQLLVIDGIRQEIDGTGIHRLGAHRHGQAAHFCIVRAAHCRTLVLQTLHHKKYKFVHKSEFIV